MISPLPKHVAIIMDGNGRWAKKRGKSRIFGHKSGVKSACRAIKFALDNNLNALTLYALSIENLNRPAQEVSSLIELFSYSLDNETKNLKKNNIKLKIIGDKERFGSKLKKSIYLSEKSTENNNGLIVNVAINYSGRWDIVQATKKIAKLVQSGNLTLEEINEKKLSKLICMNEIDPVDLVIRTGGELRLSNFLLWQIAYAELFFTDVLWPDFNKTIFKNALYNFSRRKRTFGKIIF